MAHPASTPPDLDALDRRLLDRVQQAVPLEPRPWAAVARELDTDEATVLDRLAALRGPRGVIRQISAIFDTHALGYASSLVGAKVDPARIEEAAAVVSGHPGVSHNYQREAELNLWYTLAVPRDSKLGLQGTVDRLHALSAADSTRLLPTLKLFKIGVRFQLDEDASGSSSGAFTEADRAAAQAHAITEADKPLIRVLQQDLPIEPEPFNAWAAQAGCPVEQLLAGAERYRARKQMRRFAAVLHHRAAGMRANVMGVWACDADRAEDCGRQLAGFDAVSHCYLRPAYEDWPYRLYTMVHARTRDAALATLADMQRATGLPEPRALWSVREFKKTRVRYFTGETERWEADHAG